MPKSWLCASRSSGLWVARISEDPDAPLVFENNPKGPKDPIIRYLGLG